MADKTLRKVNNLQEQRAENFRYWRTVSPGDRLIAASELSVAIYGMKKVGGDGNDSRSKRTLIRVQRP